MSVTKKLSALCVSTALVLTLSLSYFFIAEELNHHCPGNHCTACKQLDTCLQTISAYFTITDTGGNIAKLPSATVIYTTMCITATSALMPSHTLVSLGVKLTD